MRKPRDLDIDFSGATVLRTVIPIGDAAPRRPGIRLADLPIPGPILAEFDVEARAVPWKAPTVTRRGATFKNPALVTWQRKVKAAARDHMVGRDAFAGPVAVAMVFRLTECRNKSYPDATNLLKAAEDAIQGSVIVNDRQVCMASSIRVIDAVDRATIRVHRIEEEAK